MPFWITSYILGLVDGETDGLFDGLILGLKDDDGEILGLIDGDIDADGLKLGLIDGDSDADGDIDGEILGLIDGEYSKNLYLPVSNKLKLILFLIISGFTDTTLQILLIYDTTPLGMITEIGSLGILGDSDGDADFDGLMLALGDELGDFDGLILIEGLRLGLALGEAEFDITFSFNKYSSLFVQFQNTLLVQIFVQ